MRERTESYEFMEGSVGFAAVVCFAWQSPTPTPDFTNKMIYGVVCVLFVEERNAKWQSTACSNSNINLKK